MVAACDGFQVGAPPRADDPADFTGRVTRVVDGDTFWLDTQPVSIRVFGLDAPERGHPSGSSATAALTRMIAGEHAVGRPETKIGAHVVGRNTGTIGICLIGGHGSSGRDRVSDHFTDAQEQTLRKLIAEIGSRTAIDLVTGHNQYAAKACPGFCVPSWLATVSLPAG